MNKLHTLYTAIDCRARCCLVYQLFNNNIDKYAMRVGQIIVELNVNYRHMKCVFIANNRLRFTIIIMLQIFTYNNNVFV